MERYIVIEGNIGAGKTSLVTKLADDIGMNLVLEQYADNPFLPKFYANPARFSFQLEVSFLADRYRQLKASVLQGNIDASVVIADYYFVKSLIFARVTLQSDDFELYKQLFDIIWQQLPKPSLYVYLNSPIERVAQNIKERGREYEQNIELEYLMKIQDSYFEYFSSEKDFPIVVVDTARIDFVNRYEDYEKMKQIINRNDYQKGITYL